MAPIEIHIDSRDRSSGTNTDFETDLRPELQGMTLGLKTAQIPFSFYIFNATNNIVDFSEGGGALTATITPGTYSSATFVAELKTRLDGAGALTYTVTVSGTTGLVTIAATGAFELLWGTGVNAATSPATLLGFAAADLTLAATYTSTGVAMLTGADGNVFIRLQGVTSGAPRGAFSYQKPSAIASTPLGSSNVFAVVPIDVAPFEVIVYAPEVTMFKLAAGAQIDALRIQLTDKAGTPLDLHGVPWSMTFIADGP